MLLQMVKILGLCRTACWCFNVNFEGFFDLVTRRETTTEAFIPKEIILSILTDEEALAYVSCYPENIKKSTPDMLHTVL